MTGHAHRYIIAPPRAEQNGLTPARCLTCGVERTFLTAFPNDVHPHRRRKIPAQASRKTETVYA